MGWFRVNWGRFVGWFLGSLGGGGLKGREIFH